MSGEQAAVHTVTIECEPNGYWPTLRFTCQAPPAAECRTICPNSECEEGCYHFGEPGHEREAVDYCNTVTWLDEADEIAGDIFGGPTSITAPVLVSWERGEEGPLWRFAALATATPARLSDEALATELREACDAVGIPHSAEALIRHHRGNAALAASFDTLAARAVQPTPPVQAEAVAAVIKAVEAIYPPYNYELRYDGTEDPTAAAYVDAFREVDRVLEPFRAALAHVEESGATDGE